jgi:hypothetical protein
VVAGDACTISGRPETDTAQSWGRESLFKMVFLIVFLHLTDGHERNRRSIEGFLDANE